MAGIVLALIVGLWLLGFVQIPYLNRIIFSILGYPVSLYNIFLFLLVLWIIEILPSPLRTIVAILFILWILSILGIITIGGFSHVMIIAIIVGLVITVIK